MNSVVLKVDGMSCGGCSGAVTEALQGVEGTQDVNVSLDDGTATLKYSGTDNTVLINAISKDAGKEASVISVTQD